MAAETATTFLGLKYSATIAGFLGSLVALTFLKELTVLQMLAALTTGITTSCYTTPIFMYYLGLPVVINDGVAFIVGVVAMNLIPALIKLSEGIKADPLSFIKKLLQK